jgi:soluble lytic murein transglycosylase-like protein
LLSVSIAGCCYVTAAFTITNAKSLRKEHGLNTLIKKYSEKYGFNPEIVYGVCMRESTMNPKATRYESGYRWLYHVDQFAKENDITPGVEKRQQMTSFGVMQVMGGVLRELGYKGRLSDILYDAEIQIDYGCRHLAYKIKKYGLAFGILAYNSGSPSKDKAGVRYPPEQQPNAYYLKKVLEYSKGYAEWLMSAEEK